jgi:hypothetical protein
MSPIQRFESRTSHYTYRRKENASWNGWRRRRQGFDNDGNSLCNNEPIPQSRGGPDFLRRCCRHRIREWLYDHSLGYFHAPVMLTQSLAMMYTFEQNQSNRTDPRSPFHSSLQSLDIHTRLHVCGVTETFGDFIATARTLRSRILTILNYFGDFYTLRHTRGLAHYQATQCSRGICYYSMI